MLHMVDNLVQPIPVDSFIMKMHDESFKVGVGGGQVGWRDGSGSREQP